MRDCLPSHLYSSNELLKDFCQQFLVLVNVITFSTLLECPSCLSYPFPQCLFFRSGGLSIAVVLGSAVLISAVSSSFGVDFVAFSSIPLLLSHNRMCWQSRHSTQACGNELWLWEAHQRSPLSQSGANGKASFQPAGRHSGVQDPSAVAGVGSTRLLKAETTGCCLSRWLQGEVLRQQTV